MLIPISILWGTQMEFRRKFALVCIFSLVIITVVFSILRTSTISALTHAPDPSWLYMWSAIEASVGKLLQAIYVRRFPILKETCIYSNRRLLCGLLSQFFFAAGQSLATSGSTQPACLTQSVFARQ